MHRAGGFAVFDAHGVNVIGDRVRDALIAIFALAQRLFEQLAVRNIFAGTQRAGHSAGIIPQQRIMPRDHALFAAFRQHAIFIIMFAFDFAPDQFAEFGLHRVAVGLRQKGVEPIFAENLRRRIA